MSTTLKPKRWSPSLVDADRYAFHQTLYEGIEGKDWVEMYDFDKIMSKAVGVKKPQEAHKARALWAMKAAKDRRDEFYDPARKGNFLGRNKRRLELCQRPNCGPGQSPKVRGRSVLKWLKALWKQGSNGMRS